MTLTVVNTFRRAAAWILYRLGLSEKAIKGEDDASFSNRIRAQKAAFLLKALGAPIGYDFSMYIHGPYSPDLSDDYYSMTDEEIKRLAEEAAPEMSRFKEAIKMIKKADLETLELAATLLDLAMAEKERPGILCKRKPEDALRIVKPWANDEQVRGARRLLERLGISC